MGDVLRLHRTRVALADPHWLLPYYPQYAIVQALPDLSPAYRGVVWVGALPQRWEAELERLYAERYIVVEQSATALPAQTLSAWAALVTLRQPQPLHAGLPLALGVQAVYQAYVHRAAVSCQSAAAVEECMRAVVQGDPSAVAAAVTAAVAAVSYPTVRTQFLHWCAATTTAVTEHALYDETLLLTARRGLLRDTAAFLTYARRPLQPIWLVQYLWYLQRERPDGTN